MSETAVSLDKLVQDTDYVVRNGAGLGDELFDIQACYGIVAAAAVEQQLTEEAK